MASTPDILTAADIEAVPPGTRKMVELDLFTRASGENARLTFHVARGAEPGPRIGLAAMVAGNAPWGTLVIREVLKRIDLSTMKGTIIAVPTVNVLAFEQFTRSNTTLDQDRTSISSVYPGDPHGTMIERLAYCMTNSFIDNVDVVVNYASGGGSSIHYTLINGDETADAAQSFQLSRMLGTKFIYSHGDEPQIPNSTGGYAASLGKIVVIPELGGTGVLPADYLETSVTATLNMLKSLGMIEGEPELPEQQLFMHRPRAVPVADHGGLFVPVVGVEGLDAIVDEGTVLGRVINPHTLEEVQVFRAPYEKSALLMVTTTVKRVHAGDYLYIIANATDGVWLDRPTDWSTRIEDPV